MLVNVARDVNSVLMKGVDSWELISYQNWDIRASTFDSKRFANCMDSRIEGIFFSFALFFLLLSRETLEDKIDIEFSNFSKKKSHQKS